MQLPNTDDADPITVLAVLSLCARSWQPEARIVGNVRAGDIVRAIDMLMPIRDAELLQIHQVSYAAFLIDEEAFKQPEETADRPEWVERRTAAFSKARKILTLPFDSPDEED